MKVGFQTVWFLVVSLIFGCGRGATEQETASADTDEIVMPSITDERTDLIFTWFADGGAQTAGKAADVPEGARKNVRVQDPAIPPENAAPDFVFLADLTAPKKDGRYPVKAEKRDAYEAQRRAAIEREEKARQATLAAQTPPAASAVPLKIDPNAPPVIMYATKHCPVCVKARRWLLEQKIPYVEKDLETDQEAAADLQQKGAAQGIPVRGVPVFEIFGRIVPGFDPGTIVNMLKQGAAQLQHT